MHQEHRTWFPFIMVGVSILLIVVYIIWGRPVDVSVDQTPAAFEEIVEGPTEDQYIEAIQGIFSQFEEGADAGQTYDELLQVKVPARFKDLHLELVIAIAEFRANNIEEGQARLDLLKQQNTWLN